MLQASENQSRSGEWRDSTEGTCYSGGRGSGCPSEVRTWVLLVNCKSEVETSIEMFRRPNTTKRVTNSGDFSPVGGDEFVIGQSVDRVGIQNYKKGSKRSNKGNLRREIRKRL